MKRSIGCMIAICILLSSITVNAQIGQFWADGDFKIAGNSQCLWMCHGTERKK